MERTALSAPIRQIAWGYLLLYLHINLNGGSVTVDLLPDWMGFFLIAEALSALSAARPSLGLIVRFGWALGVWEMVGLIADRIEWLPLFELVSLTFSLMTLYVHFQLLTDLAALAREQLPGSCGEERSRTLLRLRTGSVGLNTMVHLPDLLLVLPEWGLLLFLLAGVFMALWSAFALFGLAKELEAPVASGSEET